MTLEEKATMLSGSGWMESASIPRLGIPAIKMADGPMGVRSWLGSAADTSAANANVKIETTAFPSGIALASSWDTDLVQREGRAIAQEIKTLGRDMILGPTVNINRQSLQTGQHTPNYRRSKRHRVCDLISLMRETSFLLHG